MYEPDSFDWKIIALLKEDGRMPSAEIARKLGDVSARTVTNRIDALIKNSIINIRAVVNPKSVGYGVMADVYVEVDSIAGTGRGADTAVVLKPVNTVDFFDIRIKEILCKPHF